VFRAYTIRVSIAIKQQSPGISKKTTFASQTKLKMNTATTNTAEKRIRVGISHGDFNGIGYEVIIKAFADNRMLELLTPIIYGHSRVASFHRKNTPAGDFNFNLVKDARQAHPKRVNIVNCTENDLKIDLGQSTPLAGEAAYQALEMAVADLKEDKIDVLVTAPINKQNIQSGHFYFPGHTEYLAERFGKKEPLMLMVWNDLRVGTITGHMPLKEVAPTLSIELILRKLRILNESLQMDFGIRKPKIALLGLNPHAGDGGLLGSEENDIIIPAIQKAKDEQILSFGPFPADGFFGSSSWKKFDAVLSMYHDQGLIGFKSIAFEGGVNYTAGLEYVRTSPAHGTAYEIAGQNLASASAFRQAVYLAVDVYKNRSSHKELINNQLANENNNR
jgi:4-hydroxythreonine-4-phosphate dehydrogenase